MSKVGLGNEVGANKVAGNAGHIGIGEHDMFELE